jgi:hypothetical protein
VEEPFALGLRKATVHAVHKAAICHLSVNSPLRCSTHHHLPAGNLLASVFGGRGEWYQAAGPFGDVNGAQISRNDKIGSTHLSYRPLIQILGAYRMIGVLQCLHSPLK